MSTTDADLIRLAEQQHGLVTRQQAHGAGLDREQWRHRLARGEWERITPRVVRRPGSPPSPVQRALAAVLDVGPSAYLAHESAAAHWGAPGRRVDPHEVMVLRGRRTPSRLANVHRPRHLPDPFAAVLDGVPVVRPALVLLQLAPTDHPERLRRLLDWFWSRRLLSGPSVCEELADLMHRGRPGTVALRALLDELPDDYTPPASALEGRFARILANARLPEMRRQVDLGGERWCGRVDFVAADLPLVAEIDSETYHTALSSRADDAVREEALTDAGFMVVRITDQEVWHHPRLVVDRVRAARHLLLRHRRAA